MRCTVVHLSPSPWALGDFSFGLGLYASSSFSGPGARRDLPDCYHDRLVGIGPFSTRSRSELSTVAYRQVCMCAYLPGTLLLHNMYRTMAPYMV